MTQKQRSLVNLAVLVVLCGAAGGAALWSHRDGAEKKQAETKAAQLFSFDKDQVTALTVIAKGQTTVLGRDKDGWRMTQPLEAPADATTVESVLSNLAQVKRKSLVDEHPTELAKFGLGAPATRVTATFPGGTAELALGAPNEYAGGQYARAGTSDAVLLIEGNHEGALGRTTFDFREKRLAIFDEQQVQKLEVDAAPDRFVIERVAGAWKVTSPKQELADPVQIANLLGVAQNLRATAVADETGQELTRFGLDAPVARITVTLQDGKSVQVLFGQASVGNEKREYAHSSTNPVVAQVPLGSHDKLHASMEALEDKTVAHLNRDEVAALEFSDAAGQKILVQHQRHLVDGGEAADLWTQLAPKSGPAKRWKMNALLFMFSNLKATKVVGAAPEELARFGLDKPAREASAQDASGKDLVKLELGREEATSVYVHNAGDARIFEVEKSRLAELPKGADDLLDLPTTPATAAK